MQFIVFPFKLFLKCTFRGIPQFFAVVGQLIIACLENFFNRKNYYNDNNIPFPRLKINVSPSLFTG